jgi:hypothetical protein
MGGNTSTIERTPSRGATRRTILALWLGAMCISLGFAIYTDHRWEDYYITFRTSKNLATGNGLVFQPGERLHTFTSPLGVLLPAAASWLVGPARDDAALWLFRILSSGALGAAVVLAWLSARAWRWSAPACGLLAAWLLTDAKSVDFAINGMETAFMLLFLALTVHTLATAPQHATVRLGLAWAGLMWTRPDSFIYIGGLALGCWIFPRAQRIAATRAAVARIFLGAGIVCLLAYGPWLLWAWQYYGSPIPNTIVAKSLSTTPLSLGQLVQNFLLLPFRVQHATPLDATFMPSYYFIGGDWSVWFLRWSRACAWIALVACFVPGLKAEARALSAAFFVSVFYLAHILPFPWYRPPSSWLAMLALAATFDSIRAAIAKGHPIWRQLWFGSGSVIAAVSATLLVCSAWQLRWQQAIVEGQRRAVGEWLSAQRTTPRDTVYLEPLGYIGYFSQLKMFDHAGLASREVVDARRRLGGDWVPIIRELAPDWVVCRQFEPLTEGEKSRAWFKSRYELVKVFDSSAQISAIRFLPGREY